MLPDAIPPQFQSTYTPIAAAGTQVQITHMARLLATQLTAAGLGKGYEETQRASQAARQAVRTLPLTGPPDPPRSRLRSVRCDVGAAGMCGRGGACDEKGWGLSGCCDCNADKGKRGIYRKKGCLVAAGDAGRLQDGAYEGKWSEASSRRFS